MYKCAPQTNRYKLCSAPFVTVSRVSSATGGQRGSGLWTTTRYDSLCFKTAPRRKTGRFSDLLSWPSFITTKITSGAPTRRACTSWLYTAVCPARRSCCSRRERLPAFGSRSHNRFCAFSAKAIERFWPFRGSLATGGLERHGKDLKKEFLAGTARRGWNVYCTHGYKTLLRRRNLDWGIELHI